MEMNIYNVNGPQGIGASRPISAPKRSVAERPRANLNVRDEMQISAKQNAQGAEAVATVSLNSNEIRLDLVNRVRAEIAAGTYYSDEKLFTALDRMLGDLV